MPRNVRTARGDVVDFDTIIIKQQIAQAPMNIEVQRRKEFIDNKEGRVRGARAAAQPVPEVAPVTEPIEVEPAAPVAQDFEIEEDPTAKKKK